jgi:hypothetical protein
VSYVTLRWLSKKCTYFAACQRWPKAKIGEEELGVEEPNPEPDGTIRRSFRRTAAGKLAGGERVDLTPWQGGSDDPPQKLGPPSGPPGFSG